MPGVNLELYLRLVRADWGAWLGFLALAGVLAALALSSLGARRVLLRCVTLSIVLHAALVLGGQRSPVVRRALWPEAKAAPPERIRQIKLVPWGHGDNSSPKDAAAEWDLPGPQLALADPEPPRPRRESPPTPERTVAPPELPPPPENVAPEPPESPASEALPPPPELPSNDAPAPAPADEIAAAPRRAAGSNRLELAEDLPMTNRGMDPTPNLAAPAELGAGSPLADAVAPAPTTTDAPEPRSIAEATPGAPLAPDSAPATVARRGPSNTGSGTSSLPDLDLRNRLRPGTTRPAPSAPRADNNADLVAMAPVPPRLNFPGIDRAERTPAEVPEVYRARMMPDRSARARAQGASEASEMAVERALNWLARHQDADGRWNGGVVRYPDGSIAPDDHDHTAHCQPGDICKGSCYYWEADSALTGLALLAFLGAGHTHRGSGTHAPAVKHGLEFLVSIQKPDGDLRNGSEAVGMYCHGMASLALCEAYALTGDPALRKPAQRAVDFLARAQGPMGRGWRYKPGAAEGDTSVLGWMVLVLKSAQVAGLDVPESARSNALGYLKSVAAGDRGGLASYQRQTPVTMSMTAEAWACRQFLNVGGPGAPSDEAAAYLLRYLPGRTESNFYAWYYATLALFQHGGPAWQRWNSAIRDELVRSQRTAGCATGSWDPDKSKYGSYGGRIFSTATAALTLEVYYRYLRLYDLSGGAATGH